MFMVFYHGDFTDKSSDDWDDDWAIPNVYIYIYIHGVFLWENPNMKH